MNPTPDQVAAGHAFYTRRSLAVYDLAILGYFSRLAWKCPARRILQHYDAHVTANHLDIGVGTGYFLDRCHFPSPPRLVLMDPSDACLAKAGERGARYQALAPPSQRARPHPYRRPGARLDRHDLPPALPPRETCSRRRSYSTR